MTTFTSYDSVGIKEDISDIITNISPTKTPFLSSIGNEKVTQKLFQWQTDVLRTPANAPVAEGADASFITVTPTVMVSNTTQIFMEAVQVSGSLEATSEYGRARESAYQLAKTAAALKRDLEVAFVGTAQASITGSDGVARQMNGFQKQVASANVVYMGASTNLTEAALLTCMQDIFNAGADPTRIQVTPANSLIVAGFAAAAGRYRTLNTGGDDKSLVNVVNLYVSPFGEQKVEVNRFLKAVGTVVTGDSTSTAGNTIIFDPDMWARATLRPWTRETLAKTGDSLKMMIVGEFSLKHKAPLASGVVVDNAASGF
jgi:hypothetical protein